MGPTSFSFSPSPASSSTLSPASSWLATPWPPPAVLRAEVVDVRRAIVPVVDGFLHMCPAAAAATDGHHPVSQHRRAAMQAGARDIPGRRRHHCSWRTTTRSSPRFRTIRTLLVQTTISKVPNKLLRNEISQLLLKGVDILFRLVAIWIFAGISGL
jgi:hypothetical protein